MCHHIKKPLKKKPTAYKYCADIPANKCWKKAYRNFCDLHPRYKRCQQKGLDGCLGVKRVNICKGRPGCFWQKADKNNKKAYCFAG